MTDSISPVSQRIWDMKYRLKAADGSPVDRTLADSWRRVAIALAAPERAPKKWQKQFFEILDGFTFLPAGRILAGAGSGRRVTLFNCFVMGTIADDMAGIFDSLKEAALTMQQGGGIGHDFSTLRPRGAPVRGVGADASGPISFMNVWDAMCRTIMSAGYRRGAMMATLKCDHPDIEAFIEAKREPGQLRMFNLSVLVTDAFMTAIEKDQSWDLVFDGTVYKTVAARGLWDKIMRATFAYAEPGVVFIDRVNRANNLHYAETISCTNPCGEQPLPPYGSCLLGSINLTRLVNKPFEDGAALDLDVLEKTVRAAVRMLDNTIDVSGYPLPEQEREARAKRRIGLGVTGLADALILCRARYGGPESLRLVETWMSTIRRAAYLASTELAAEKGPFPLYEAAPYLAGETVQGLDGDVIDAIRANGMRNGLLTSVAPTGTISLLADNVSSGIEPVFSFTHRRTMLMADGTSGTETISDHAYRLYRTMFGDDAALPDYFVDAQKLTPSDHVAMQAVAQRFVDSAISKTINCPESISFEDFKSVYRQAYDSGCKGCATYRPNEITGSVLQPADPTEAAGEDAQTVLPLETSAALTLPSDEFDAGVVYLTQPLDRPEELPGATYKVRWPESDHAFYITINDIVQDGRRRPFEIFINSKNMEHYAWTLALTRMISAVFRRGGDVSFVVEELKAVFDPRGGQWIAGHYVPSLLAAIGGAIEKHMIAIGFLPTAEDSRDRHLGGGGSRVGGCVRCGARALVRSEGCETCTECGYSRCD